MPVKKNTDTETQIDDKLCPHCGRERALVVKCGEGGMPAKCVAYHPGYDTPGIRRYSPSGVAWLVDATGIRRRDPENDVINHRREI
jgi:hypothetical protein